MGVTKWLTQACTIPPTMSNHTASVSNMTINRNNAATTNALTMPSGMVFASVTVQSAIAQSLVATSRCFKHGSADFTSGVFQQCRTFWQQQMQWLVCVMMHLLRPQVVLLGGKKFITLIMAPQSWTLTICGDE